MNTYAIDLALRPSTFDFWHVCLTITVVALLALLVLLLLTVVFGKKRTESVSMAPNLQSFQPSQQTTEPTVKVIEKVVEVEKLVPAPEPEPVILKEYTQDAALQVLALLQKEARFIDFLQEDVTAYSDTEIGAAARVVHQGCTKVLKEHFSFASVRSEQEGSNITLEAGFDAAANRLTGNIVGAAPFVGTLVHKGWKVTDVRLPKITPGHSPDIVAAAEIEL